MKENLLFYNAYERFYSMTANSNAFKKYCIDAFGADFSQDGFSDISQINMILQYIPNGKNAHILDIGCGNGKMLKYLQDKTDCFIHGFDYSENAIEQAKNLCKNNADFRTVTLDNASYNAESFDVIISMDSIYFTENMNVFVRKVKTWLKKNGVFFIAYQEGDVMPKTNDCYSTEIAKAFKENNMNFDVLDITENVYNMLKNKRECSIKYRDEFIKEENIEWYELIIMQTKCVSMSFDEYKKHNARYIYKSDK